MRLQLWLFGLSSLACACASTPRTAVVNGVVVPRHDLDFAGQPFSIHHSAAHPHPGGPSSGLRDYGGKIAGQVCGMDIDYQVQHEGDHVQLVGFLDQTFASEIQVRDRAGQREITGSLGGLGVELLLRSNQLLGHVGLRVIDLKQEDDQLLGEMKISGTDEPTTATVKGRDALWGLPAADQAAVLPNLLTCYIASIGRFGRTPLHVGFGGPAGALPHESSTLYSHGY